MLKHFAGSAEFGLCEQSRLMIMRFEDFDHPPLLSVVDHKARAQAEETSFGARLSAFSSRFFFWSAANLVRSFFRSFLRRASDFFALRDDAVLEAAIWRRLTIVFDFRSGLGVGLITGCQADFGCDKTATSAS